MMNRIAYVAASLCLSAFVLVSCTDDGDADGESGGADESSSGDSASTMSTTISTTMTTADPTSPGCIPGSEDCGCLDGDCVGSLQCVEEVCKPGPTFEPDVDEARSVLGGLVVPVVVDVVADEFSWSQTAGPAVQWEGEAGSIQVQVPPDAAVGEVITLRITAVRNTIESTFDYEIGVREPVFEDVLGAVTDLAELGTSVGLDFDNNGNMWVSSSEGFISRFAIDGAFQSRYELSGAAGIRWGSLSLPDSDDDINVLYVAQTGPGAISAYNPANDSFTTITDALEDTTALGPLEVVLPSDGNLFTIDPDGGRILQYDDEDATTRVLSSAVSNPAVLSFGPDANVLYVGGVGSVWRVGLLQDGTASEPELYVEFGDAADPTQEVGGLAFDEGGNLWIGVPQASALHLAHYSATGATETVRSFTAVGAGYSAFANLRYGNGDFSDSAVYWTNGSDRTVARIETGLRRL